METASPEGSNRSAPQRSAAYHRPDKAILRPPANFACALCKLLQISPANPWHDWCDCTLMRRKNRPHHESDITERPNMKTSKYFALLAATMLPPLMGFSQTTDPPTAASQASAPSNLSWGATEVAKLAQSGVSDDVIRAFIDQSQSYYNLSAADIAALKEAGVSSQAVTSMLDHDGALRTQQASAAPAASTPGSPQIAATQSDMAASTATPNPASANTTVVVQSAPPEPQEEIIPVSPGPDYFWTPGCWSWNGGGWIWIGGFWGHPFHPLHPFRPGFRSGHFGDGRHWEGHGRGGAWGGGHRH